jgi:hypothetical protein
MAIERNRNDPKRPDDPFLASDPYRASGDPTLIDPTDGGRRPSSRLETDLQADPELAEGQTNGPKIALIALGIALLLGAVFYGLNNSSIHQNGSSIAQKPAPATAQNTAPTPPAAASPPSPGGNSQGGNSKSGVTTGTAPSQTAPSQTAPPQPAPAGPAQNSPDGKNPPESK